MSRTAIPRLFLDVDGVLADFDRAASEVFGMEPHAAQQRLGQARFWNTLRRHPGGFFAQLPLLPDAEQLFRAVEPLQPTLLTGCPFGGWAEPQKRAWAAKHFPGTPILTCMARDKARHAQVSPDNPAILVDDTPKHRGIWEAAGGLFVHHRSAEATLRDLQALGLLPPAP